MHASTSDIPQKKKILIGIDNLFIGGAQQQLLEQFPYFNRERYELHVATLVTDPKRSHVTASVPSFVQIQSFAFRGFFDVVSWYSLCAHIYRLRPDFIVSNLFLSNTVFRIIAFLYRIPIVSVEHNTYIRKTKRAIFIDRLLSRVSKKIVAVSQEVAVYASQQAHIPLETFVVIHNGIDISRIDRRLQSINAAAVRREMKFSPLDRIILHVGRLVSQKRQELLMRGFVDFQRTHAEWRLLIVGGGPLEASLRALAQTLDTQSVILFTGEQRDVHPYYAISECFITTSDIEGMSTTHLEALAHGLPILSTKTGGTGSIIQDGITGYIIPESTPEAVSQTLARFSQSDIRAMSQSSKARRTSFDIRRAVEQYQTLFEKYT